MSRLNRLLERSPSSQQHTVISISRAWTAAEFQIVGVIFGITLGFGYFVVCHAVRQTRKINTFTVLIWLGISANLTSTSVTFLNASGVIDTATPYNLCIIHLWAIQLNCVFQIMVSRIILIWSSPSHRQLLRWGILAWALFLVGAAFSTWIPARLRISEKIIRINAICYPITRLVCLLTNACLNVTFIYSVKKTLVVNGLEKYNKLLKFTAKIMGFSLILDLVPIVLLISQSSLVYISFFPLSTMVKLEMELVTNDLIVEVIKSEQQLVRIRESYSGVIPGYPTFPTFDGRGSKINTPHSFGFSNNDEHSKKQTDIWQLPPISSSLASPDLVHENGKIVPRGSFYEHSPSPIDSESDEWTHSRMSSGMYILETDLSVELWTRGF